MVASTLKIDAGDASKILAQLNQHVMIVGASRGIGEALAHRLSGATGMKLTLASRRYNALNGLKMALGSSRVHTVQLDLRDNDSIDEAVRSAVELNGPPTGLVITAGSHKPTRLEDFAHKGRERFDEVVRVNMTGAYIVAQLVADHMSNGGSIVFLGNRQAEKGMPGRHAHAASKHGLVALARGMARELGPSGVRVNVVMPDVVDNELGSTLLAETAQRTGQPVERIQKRFKATSALRKLTTPDEIAEVIRFLLGPDSGVITGQAIDVSSGSTR